MARRRTAPPPAVIPDREQLHPVKAAGTIVGSGVAAIKRGRARYQAAMDRHLDAQEAEQEARRARFHASHKSPRGRHGLGGVFVLSEEAARRQTQWHWVRLKKEGARSGTPSSLRFVVNEFSVLGRGMLAQILAETLSFAEIAGGGDDPRAVRLRRQVREMASYCDLKYADVEALARDMTRTRASGGAAPKWEPRALS